MTTPMTPATFQPTYEPLEVLTGVAAMYVQTYNPADPPALPDPDSAVLGQAWPTPWEPLGASDSGLSFEFERKTNEIMIEETPVAVAYMTESLTINAVVSLAQDTLKTMRLAYGGGSITTVAASTGTAGTKTLRLSSNLELMTFGFETFNENGLARYVMIPTVVSVGKIKTEYRRAKDKRMYETSFQCTSRPEDIIILDVTDAPL